MDALFEIKPYSYLSINYLAQNFWNVDLDRKGKVNLAGGEGLQPGGNMRLSSVRQVRRQKQVNNGFIQKRTKTKPLLTTLFYLEMGQYNFS